MAIDKADEFVLGVAIGFCDEVAKGTIKVQKHIFRVFRWLGPLPTHD